MRTAWHVQKLNLLNALQNWHAQKLIFYHSFTALTHTVVVYSNYFQGVKFRILDTAAVWFVLSCVSAG